MATSARPANAATEPTPPFKSAALACALISFIGMFTLPYFVPTRPAFSVSYITGFNNHVAVVLFVVSAGLVAYASPSLRLRQAPRDTSLPLWTLAVALLLTGVALLLVLHQHGSAGGNESPYQLERLSHLNAGQPLYRQFEYLYGPLLLYPPHWIHRLLGWDPQPSSRLSWALQWFVGIAMLWFAVAKNRIPTPHRVLLFSLLFLFHIGSVTSEGVNHTCFRFYCATSLSVAIFLLWQRSCSSWAKIASALAAIALALAVSPEQGSALAFGLCVYALCLTRLDRTQFSLRAVLLLWAGSACLLLTALYLGEFTSLRTFADGGYNFPLLPSPIQIFSLTVYLFAALLLYQALLSDRIDTALLPLGLCGLPLLTSAFGRSDAGHVAGVAPLYLIGLFSLSRWPRLLWIYTPLLLCFFILPLAIRHTKPASFTPYGTNTPTTSITSTSANIDPANHYFAPLAVPLTEDGKLRWNADSGYYFGVWDVILPASMQAKADEIERRHAPLLLLPDTPGQPLHFPLWITDLTPAPLHSLEQSAWVPRQIRPQLDGAVIITTIQRLYGPTSQQQDGWRVWKLRQPWSLYACATRPCSWAHAPSAAPPCIRTPSETPAYYSPHR